MNVNIKLLSKNEAFPFLRELKLIGFVDGAITNLKTNQIRKKLEPHQERVNQLNKRFTQEKEIQRELPIGRKEMLDLAKKLKRSGKIKGGITNLNKPELQEKLIEAKKLIKKEAKAKVEREKEITEARKKITSQRPSVPIKLRENAPIIRTPKTIMFGDNINKLKQSRHLFEIGHVALLDFSSHNVPLGEFGDQTQKFPYQYSIKDFNRTFKTKLSEITTNKHKIQVRVIYQYYAGKEGEEAIYRYGSKNIFEKFENVSQVSEDFFEERLSTKLFNEYGIYYFTGFDIITENITNIEAGGCNLKQNDHHGSCFGWCKYADYRSNSNNCGIFQFLNT